MTDSIENIFRAVMEHIREKEGVDMQHLYIDGSKFEANANKYSWVWKKGTEKSRYRLYAKITALLEEINETLALSGLKIETNTEYTPKCLEEITARLVSLLKIDEDTFAQGRGHHKTQEQRHYEKLVQFTEKLREYEEKINICGSNRNSYSKTDHAATFMRMKQDYMGNGQLLPGYNIHTEN